LADMRVNYAANVSKQCVNFSLKNWAGQGRAGQGRAE